MDVGLDVGSAVLIHSGSRVCNDLPCLWSSSQLSPFQLLTLYSQQYVSLILLARSSHCRCVLTGVSAGQLPVV